MTPQNLHYLPAVQSCGFVKSFAHVRQTIARDLVVVVAVVADTRAFAVAK